MAARDNYGQGYGGRSTYNPWGALQGRQEQSATTPKKAFDNGKPAAAPKKAFNDGEPAALPDNFVDAAQTVMNHVARYYQDKNGQDCWSFKITTSKIRKLLGLVMTFTTPNTAARKKHCWKAARWPCKWRVCI